LDTERQAAFNECKIIHSCVDSTKGEKVSTVLNAGYGRCKTKARIIYIRAQYFTWITSRTDITVYCKYRGTASKEQKK
jgi:hypothetical protein